MTQFQENSKAIFLQIADRIADDILSGVLAPESRLPSVREYAATVQVNPNTVMRTYDLLAQQGVIFNRRGIGYFVAPDAPSILKKQKADIFLQRDLIDTFRQLSLLGIDADELRARYADYLSKQS